MSASNDTNALNGTPNPNSATIVAFGFPLPQPVANTDNLPSQLIEPNPADQAARIATYLNGSLTTPGSPFVATAATATNLSINNLQFNFGGGGPFGGGGGGGDNQPDDVPDSFKLEAIGGLVEQISYLKRSIILPLVRPEVLKEWGVSPPKGILLHGPPGTGKTFMAKSIVNELKKHLGRKVNFFYRKGGDVFSMWFGESERKLRDVFDTAKSMSPSVIFFDEIDGLCPSRDGSATHGTNAYASVVTCFLGQMDSLENGKVFVIGATNRLEAVDPAVRRPGRFDKHLAFGFPDEEARSAILRIHTLKWDEADRPTDNLRARLAQRTLGFSGADLEKLCTDVVYKAIEANGGVLDNTVQVTETHWLQAMSQMQRTASNSFGSSLLIPTKPSSTISRLIRPVVQQATEKILPFLSQQSLELSSTTFRKSLLLYVSPAQSKSFMNNHIVQGILSEQAFNSISMFELSPTSITNKILTGNKASVLAVVHDVVNQALDARTENPACVVVLNINEILDMARDSVPTKLILSSLANVRGPKMVLLATSSIPPDQISDLRVLELFFDERRRIKVQNPSMEQLKVLFREMFVEKKGGLVVSAAVDSLLNKIAEDAARFGENDSYDHILNLYSALSQVKIQTNSRALEVEYRVILQNYQRSKLRSD